MAQKQTINIGTVANDDTGDPLRTAFTKSNDNFDDLYLTNVVFVNSPADFPAAVAGVRELVPISGDKITYLVAAALMDMGSDRFTVTDGEVVIRGVHRTVSELKTTNTGTMFTCVDAQMFFEFIILDCASAKFIDFSTPADIGLQSFVSQNLTIRDCTTLGTIDGAFVTSFRIFSVITTSTGGFLWTGIRNSQINMSNTLFIDWTGTALDFGTATFDIISIVTGSRFLSPVGTTAISGAAAGANFNTDGRGIVEGNIFNGLGTALNGITTQDVDWEFKANVFTDNTTLNSFNAADAYLSSSQTVTITTQSVYVAINGVNWLSVVESRFSVDTAGIMTYNGNPTLVVKVAAISTVEKVGGGTDKICTKIAIDTGSGFVVQDRTEGCTENSTATGVTSLGFFQIANGDKIQVFVGNESTTANIIVSHSTVILESVV